MSSTKDNNIASNGEPIEDANFEEVEKGKPADAASGEVEVEVFDPHDPVLPRGRVVFTGEVVESLEGYSFIGKVKRGYETINTNGDVFVPKKIKVGQLVEFDELKDDPERAGKFRTDSVRLISRGFLVKSKRVQALQRLTERSTYHFGAKQIDPDKVRKAMENLPFAEKLLGIIKEEEEQEGVEKQEPKDVAELAKEFLMGQFATLKSLGVSYSVTGEVDEAQEKAKLDEAVGTFEKSGFTGQTEAVKKEFQTFTGVRNIFNLMHQNGILSLQSVIPLKYLPDLLVAAPVWYVDSKQSIEDRRNEDDPFPDHVVNFFSDAVGTKEFAWLYQMFNRRTRSLSSFDSREIIPLNLMPIIEQAKHVFDYVVICTPYHDICSKEWANPEWLRNLDPFLFGFSKDLPYMFLLGRWSGTGLFPLLCDMVADTMDFIRLNINKLENFSRNAYWYKGEARDGTYLGDSLINFAKKVLKAYDENWLFPFLRGEKPQTEEEASAVS